eukprot:scaffold6794_cov58-Phaeocystis_antarctica.AAC.3
MAAAGMHLCPENGGIRACRIMGRSAWAGWRGLAYTNVDTARRMRGCFSASDERFVSCGRAEVPISCA